MPAPRTFDREHALRRAMEVFWNRGYDAVGMRELGEAMGLGASSLYHAFGGKQPLYQEALDLYRDEVVGAWLAPLLDPEAGGVAAIEKLFERTVAAQARERGCRGCLMANAAVDVAPVDADVRARTDAHVTRMTRAFRKALERGAALGEVPPDADLDAVALGLAALSQGILVLSKATGGDATRIRPLVAQALRLVPTVGAVGAGSQDPR